MMSKSISHLLKPSAQLQSKRLKDGFIDSPLRILPQELLIAVFLSCIDPIPFELLARVNPTSYTIGASRNPIPHQNTFKAIINLCHVCNFWRFTILSTPVLWSTFSLQADTGNKAQAEAQIFVSLSASCPLSFSLSFRGEFSLTPYPSISNVLQILWRHSHRWTHATVSLRGNDDAITLSSALPLASHSLQTLSIINEDLGFLINHRMGVERLSFPKLQILHLTELQGIPPSYIMPCLQELICSKLSSDDFFLLLDACPSLQRCDARILSSPQLKSNPKSAYTTRRHTLHTLRIYAHENVFNFLELPQLRRLRFDDSTPPEEEDNADKQTCLARLFSRSYLTPAQAALEEIEIASLTLTDGDITKALSFVPHLKVLKVAGPQLTNEGKVALTIHPAGDSLGLGLDLTLLEWRDSYGACWNGRIPLEYDH